MRKLAGCVFCLVLLTALAARADTLVKFDDKVGSYGASSWTFDGLITANAYYLNTTTNTWQAANLFGRNEANDHGIGVCDPAETNCGSGSGQGDINELDNAGKKELIRLTLPAGYKWVSVQLSSLDKNSSSLPSQWERGLLATDSTGSPGGPLTTICTFAPDSGGTCAVVGGTAWTASSSFEPILGNLGADASDQYLFFKPYDWTTGHYNTNNDYLIAAATIKAPPVPEPASMLLLGSGLVTIASVVRRKRRS